MPRKKQDLFDCRQFGQKALKLAKNAFIARSVYNYNGSRQKKAKCCGRKPLTASIIKSGLKGPEKWLAIAEARKKEKKEMKKIQTGRLLRKSGLTNSTSRSQYFVDKYPLVEKTREEWQNALEEKPQKNIAK